MFIPVSPDIHALFLSPDLTLFVCFEYGMAANGELDLDGHAEILGTRPTAAGSGPAFFTDKAKAEAYIAAACPLTGKVYPVNLELMLTILKDGRASGAQKTAMNPTIDGPSAEFADIDGLIRTVEEILNSRSPGPETN